MSGYRWLGAAGALAMAAGGVALALDRPPVRDEALPDILLERLHAGATLEQYVAQLAAALRQADRQRDGLDREDVALARAVEGARARAAAVSEVLAHDLDGDLIVTQAEMLRLREGEEPGRSRMAEALLERFDTDGDDRITIAEAAAGAAPPRGGAGLDALLALDPNGDGRVTAAELGKRAERAFALVDRDGDGTLSPKEFALITERVREAQAARYAPTCAMPPVPAGARLIAYSGYESDAISSVAVGGPDQETNLLDVTIEPGREPLYLVLSSYESMVWRLSGATGRVARVVVSSYHSARRAPVGQVGPTAARAVVVPSADELGGMSAAGVVGVPADRVTIGSRSCPRYGSTAGDPAMRASLQRSLGRTPDAMFGAYSANRISLPSGAITKAERDTAPAPAGFDPTVWREAVRFWPGGLVHVDPATVVAKVRVAKYQVLPSQMGLAQLVGAGAAVNQGSDRFRIVRPIARMPPSMGGSHSATLVFARGVPVPPGDPVHSCIVREDSDERTGAACGLRR
jgi:hypothetical protein